MSGEGNKKRLNNNPPPSWGGVRGVDLTPHPSPLPKGERGCASHRAPRSTHYEIKGLYSIIDNSFTPGKSHLELAGEILIGGCKILQLRMKKGGGLWDQEVFNVAKSIIELKSRFDFTFIINDYVDVAAEVGADGVHVGGHDMSVEDVRQRVEDKLIVGYSSHSLDEALKAEKAGADYVGFGGIFPTPAKGSGHPVQGIDKLKKVVEGVNVPVVAIGGINRDNVDDVLSTGVTSVAMIRGLTCAENTVTETRWYVEKFERSRM